MPTSTDSRTRREQRVFLLIYIGAVALWCLVWGILDAYVHMTGTYQKLWLPFLVCLVYLIGNAILNRVNWYVGPVEEEEELFNPINARLGNVFTAATAVLAIAALIYTIKDEPASEAFVHFASYTFIFGLITMLILWIPGNRSIWKFYFRHVQTITMTYCISLSMGSILILLEDLSGVI